LIAGRVLTRRFVVAGFRKAGQDPPYDLLRLFSLREHKKALPLIKFSSTEDKKGIPMEQFCFPE
jgi:hypothetical protein